MYFRNAWENKSKQRTILVKELLQQRKQWLFVSLVTQEFVLLYFISQFFIKLDIKTFPLFPKQMDYH